MTTDVLTATPDEPAVPRRAWNVRGILLAGVAAPLGVLLVAVGNNQSVHGAPGGVPLFWAGLVLIVGAAAVALWRGEPSRSDAIGVLLITGLALFAVKVLRSPAGLTGYDELLHYRTLDDLVQTGRLFNGNALLPISPYYPGIELLATVLMRITGLGIFWATMIVAGACRVLMVLATFLLLERVAQPPRLAALATLLYMACPNFLYFDSMFAYESLALPLAIFCFFALRTAQMNEGGKRFALNVAGVLAGLTVVVTHHVTSFILAGTLVLWTLMTLVFRRVYPERLPGDVWGPVVIVAAVTVWLLEVASLVVSYLWPQVLGAVAEFMRIVNGESAGRRLFESNVGISAPPLERIVGIGAVLLTCAVLPFGLWYLWKNQRRQPLAWMFAIGAVAYPATMLLRFTKSGWDIGARATAFIYIPLALVLAGGAEWLRTRRPALFARTLVAVPVIVVIFAGGVVAGSGPSSRQPQPYRAGAGERSIDAETLAAAVWARDVLGPNNRIAADETNAAIMGSYGRQRVVTNSDGVSITGLFLAPGLGAYQRELINKAAIRYVVVDRRIAGIVPLKGFFYERWEKKVYDYGKTVDAETLSRFDDMPEISRIYDSGNIQIYDVSGWAR